ncbi:MAG: ribonuclease III [Alphaproteobacteria bacterium]|nr:ribonuclease III [Alphaproteobacteria bacterium]
MTAPAADDLERRIGYSFGNPDLLTEALTHASALPQAHSGRRRTRRTQHGGMPRNYERLEFLGDRVLGLVIADLLWRQYATEPEGDLTRRLAQLVRRDTLAKVAATIGIDRFLHLSPAEAAAGAAQNPAILADACEALIAAVYLDGGLAAAFAFVERFWIPLIGAMQAPPRDPKTVLQEWTQARGLGLPAYQLTATGGPDHARHFTVAARVAGFDEATATASSKRAAETAAAALLLQRLTTNPKGNAPGAKASE